MNSPNFALKVASVIFLFFGVLQMVRLLTRFEVVVGGYPMPWLSHLIALVIAGGLGIWMWRLARSLRR